MKTGLRRAVERCCRQAVRRVHEGSAAATGQGVRSFGTAEARSEHDDGHVRWVFLGAPGVGKGTYASRLGRHLGIPHIAMGDIVREELTKGTPLAAQMKDMTSRGLLLPDDLVLALLSRRLESGAEAGETGYILDGFPRTTSQAATLDQVTPIDLAVNLSLREDVLMTKLLGRRMCSECGGNFNIANIQVLASGSSPGIVMPPLTPPGACVDKMSVRADDTEEVVRSRLEVYYKESKPVEDFYRRRGQLLEFEILGGIPETWPRLLHTLGVSEESDDCLMRQAA